MARMQHKWSFLTHFCPLTRSQGLLLSIAGASGTSASSISALMPFHILPTSYLNLALLQPYLLFSLRSPFHRSKCFICQPITPMARGVSHINIRQTPLLRLHFTSGSYPNRKATHSFSQSPTLRCTISKQWLYFYCLQFSSSFLCTFIIFKIQLVNRLLHPINMFSLFFYYRTTMRSEGVTGRSPVNMTLTICYYLLPFPAGYRRYSWLHIYNFFGMPYAFCHFSYF